MPAYGTTLPQAEGSACVSNAADSLRSEPGLLVMSAVVGRSCRFNSSIPDGAPDPRRKWGLSQVLALDRRSTPCKHFWRPFVLQFIKNVKRLLAFGNHNPIELRSGEYVRVWLDRTWFIKSTDPHEPIIGTTAVVAPHRRLARCTSINIVRSSGF